MHELRPKILEQNDICADMKAPPGAMVVFGASGDLTQRKLIGSLYALYTKGLISKSFFVLGCGRTNMTDDEFRSHVKEAINSAKYEIDNAKLDEFLGRLYYVSGSYDDIDYYKTISAKLNELIDKYNICGCFIYYLAVPPKLFSVIAVMLGKSGLAYTGVRGACKMSRIVIEKPFGSNHGTSNELNEQITTYFNEDQIYRIDHYLGKETVQNILMFRFANSIFEPIWNRNYIDHVQVTIAESLGIGHRAGYYEASGCLRDMFQNHLLQLLCLVAMEPPSSFEANPIRDEKVKVVESIRPIETEELGDYFVRGQYASSDVDGNQINGYLDEEGVSPDSKIETFVAAKLYIDNWRWKGVPFYLRSGKRMKRKVSEIAITFREVPHSMFVSSGIETLPPNVLVIRIQPEEGISLSFQAKRPGSKACMSTLEMDFDYDKVFGGKTPEAYQRLLLDCLSGDQTLFARHDFVEASWKVFDPVLNEWAKDDKPPFKYSAGSGSFEQADQLLQKDNRKWREI